MMVLRPGRPEDLERILSWRNARCAVRFSKSGRILTREEVSNAYHKALNSEDPCRRVIIVCMDPETPIGYLRFDLQDGGDEAEISIALDPHYQDKGYGSEALKQGSAYAFHQYGLKVIKAIVLDANEASVGAFSKAGFIRVGTDGAFATYELRRYNPPVPKEDGIDEKFMRLAIEKAMEGIQKGQSPFGACIVKARKVIGCAHNVVWETTDSTAHAEIHAIREACKVLGTIDLSGCDLYSTCEPCPMCFSACHWAKISRVIHGTRIADARRLGFSELTIPNGTMKRLGSSPVELLGDFLRKENLALLQTWSKAGNRRVY